MSECHHGNNANFACPDCTSEYREAIHAPCRTELAELRAECERLKADANRWALNEMNRLAATLAEREAQLERIRNKCEDHFGERTACGQCFDSLRSTLREREAEIEALKAEHLKDIETVRSSCRLSGAGELQAAEDERDEARAALATARLEALEEAAKVAEQRFVEFVEIDTLNTTPECDRIARRIRALAEDTKRET